MFPYEDYKAAIEDESAARGAGTEAMVLDCENVDADSGWMLQVEPLGRCVEAEIVDGTLAQYDEDGRIVFSGEIVSYDAEEKFVSLKRESVGTPRAGMLAKIRPPDYLKPLLGGEDDPELYLRSDNSFTGEYIAVKQGLMLAAIIEPELGILSASLVENVSAFANAVHSEIDRMVGIPDTDPETGEII